MQLDTLPHKGSKQFGKYFNPMGALTHASTLQVTNGATKCTKDIIENHCIGHGSHMWKPWLGTITADILYSASMHSKQDWYVSIE